MLATPSFIPLSTLVPTCKDYVKVKKGNTSDTLLMIIQPACILLGWYKLCEMTYFCWFKRKLEYFCCLPKNGRCLHPSRQPVSLRKIENSILFSRNASTLVYATAMVVVNGSEFCTLHKNKFKWFQSKQFYHFPIVQKKQVASTCSHSIIQQRNCSIK